MNVIPVLTALLCQALLASGSALSLDEALRQVPAQGAVVAAEAAVGDARRGLARTTADPYALKREVLQAQQRLELARAQAQQTYYAALSEVGTAYAAALLADLEAQVAAASEALNQRYLETFQTRAQSGEATPLEVSGARAALRLAQANRQSAAQMAASRRRALFDVLPEGAAETHLEPLPEACAHRPLPTVHALMVGGGAAADLLYARQAVEVARLDADLLDLAYSAERDVRAAERQLAAAEAQLSALTRSRRSQLRLLFAQTEAAQRLCRVQAAASAEAQAQLASQREQFLRGALSETEFRQAAFAAVSAQLELQRAEYGLLTSLLALQTAAATDLQLVPGAATAEE